MSLRSPRTRHRRPRSARSLAEHLGRPSVVCSLAVVALGASSVLAQPGPAPSPAAAGQSPMSIGTTSQSAPAIGAGNQKAMSMAALLRESTTSGFTMTTAGDRVEDRRSGSSALDPTRAPSKLHTGELPVNTLVAPAQPVVVGQGGEFGWRIAPDLGIREFHNGSDISAPAGAPVVAAAEGEVTAVFWDVWGGNRVEVAHADGLRTTYSHLEDVMVEEGDHLAAAQQLGSVGATGIRVTGPHLHFETWVDGAVTDPQSFDWITDAGVLPATASPYSLAHQAPTAEEAAAILDRARAKAKDAEVRPMTSVKVEPKAEPKPKQESAPARPAPKADPKASPAPTPAPSSEAPADELPAEPKPAEPKPAVETTPAVETAPAGEPAEAPPTAPTAAPAPDPAPSEPAAPAPTGPAEPPAETDAIQAAQRAYASPTADTDGDTVVDALDPDLDGDDIANGQDDDLDGDDIPNAAEGAPERVWTPDVTEPGR